MLGFPRPVPISFDEAHIFALEAVADGCPHNPQEHGRRGSRIREIVPSKMKKMNAVCNAEFSINVDLSVPTNGRNQTPNLCNFNQLARDPWLEVSNMG
jgi:hypothetical protein